MEEWIDMGGNCEPAYCYYKFDPDMGKAYAKL